MPELRVVGAPTELISRLDELTMQSKYHDRSAFVVAALKEYCLYHDCYFMHCLPDVVRILVQDEMQKEAKQSKELLQYSLKTINSCNKTMEQLYAILSDD